MKFSIKNLFIFCAVMLTNSKKSVHIIIIYGKYALRKESTNTVFLIKRRMGLYITFETYLKIQNVENGK